jgi:hypothetical protein
MKVAPDSSLLLSRPSATIVTLVRFFSSRACTLLALSFALVAACAWSQSDLGTVFGTVTDPSGAVISATQITIVNQSTGLTLSTVTNKAGQYHLANLPSRNYVVRAVKEGFRTELRDGIALPSASEVMINFSMVVGSQLQQVIVNANASGIDNTTSTVSGLLQEPSLVELPLNNRDLFSAVALEPGVAPDPSSAPSLLSSDKIAKLTGGGTARAPGLNRNDTATTLAPFGQGQHKDCQQGLDASE